MEKLNLRNLSIQIFGGSHQEKIGVKLEGLPAGNSISLEALAAFLKRRAPGNHPLATQRKEADLPTFLSGMEENVLNGDCLEAVIFNTNASSSDYSFLPDVPRPSHADYPAIVKYGSQLDLRGGGQFSGRLTAPLCIAGGIALQLLEQQGISVGAHLFSVGKVKDDPFDPLNLSKNELIFPQTHSLPVTSETACHGMEEEIRQARSNGDSVGGIVECGAIGLPVGLGEHLFFGMENRISQLVFAIPAAKGVEFGSGFDLAGMLGSEANDPIQTDGTRIFTTKNNNGGIQGGMTNGMPLIFRVVFKPTPSISKEQDSVSLSKMENTKLTIPGRHDPCIPVRAVPVVEAVCALAILDALLDEGGCSSC